MDYFALGKRIRKRRVEQGMTQEQLAQQVGVTTSFIGHLERGSRKASLETLVALANALHVGVDYLLCDSLNTVRNDSGPDGLSRGFVFCILLLRCVEDFSDILLCKVGILPQVAQASIVIHRKPS